MQRLSRALSRALILAPALLAGCGGTSSNPALDTSASGQPGASTEAPDSTDQINEPGNTQLPDASDSSPARVAISPEYGVSTTIYQNLMAVTDNGDAVAAWVTETQDTYSLHASYELSDQWQPATTLSNNGVVGVVTAASAQTAMLAWHQRANNTVDFSNSEIRTRLLRAGDWTESFVAGTAASDDTTRYVSDLAIAALPNDSYALLWSERLSGNATTRQLFSEWGTGQWSEPMPLATVGPYVVDNQLISTQDGDLSYLYSESIDRDNGYPLTAYFLRDRLQGQWQPPARVDQFDSPLWLETTGQGDLSVASSPAGRQIIAWRISLRDSFGTQYYAIASRQREGHAQAWSNPHFELLGNESIGQVEVAVNDAGYAVVGWRQDPETADDFSADETLSLARVGPDNTWIDVEPDLLRTDYFPTLPPTAATGLALESYRLYNIRDELRLSVLCGVADRQTSNFYTLSLSAIAGFGQQSVVAPVETGRSVSQRLLSCDTSPDSYRCSHTATRYNYTLNSNRLLTTQILASERFP